MKRAPAKPQKPVAPQEPSKQYMMYDRKFYLDALSIAQIVENLPSSTRLEDILIKGHFDYGKGGLCFLVQSPRGTPSEEYNQRYEAYLKNFKVYESRLASYEIKHKAWKIEYDIWKAEADQLEIKRLKAQLEGLTKADSARNASLSSSSSAGASI